MNTREEQKCEFEVSGNCMSDACFSSQNCGARDDYGSPKYVDNPSQQTKKSMEKIIKDRNKRPCFLFCQEPAECFDDIGKGQEKICIECFRLQDKLRRECFNDVEKIINEIYDSEPDAGKRYILTDVKQKLSEFVGWLLK